MVRRIITTATTLNTNTTATTNTTPIKRKKGRPSLLDLQNRALQQNPNNSNSINKKINNNSQSFSNINRRCRSTRRIPKLPAHFLYGSDSDDHILSGPNSIDSDPDPSDYDDDEERPQKQVKIVVQFPRKNLNNAVISQEKQQNYEKSSKATDNILLERTGTRRMEGALEHGPTSSTSTPTITSSTTPLPDNKLLLLLLERLQKKDTRGVFAEPVDPEELPDYHEIIENPMDFQTVRKKLLGGVYTILEQLEDDVNLICSNAMQYNAPSTIFFRQARAIQELAKREFDLLKQDGGLSEAPIKPRRGRPPGSRNWKKLLESSVPERSVTVRELSLESTPASREEDPKKSGSYNLRKGPSLYRFPRTVDYCFDYSGLSASSSKSISTKYGKKTFGSDESRRDTYFLSCEPDSSKDPHSLATFGGLEKELTAVGLTYELSYSRSLARFAADLGPSVWKIVSKKIQSVLPPGVDFGPGWVGEPDNSSTQSNHMSRDLFNSGSQHPTEKILEPREFNSNVEWSSPKGVNDNGLIGPDSSIQIQCLNLVNPGMNGVSGSFGSSARFQESIPRPISSPSSSLSSSLINNPYAIDSSSSLDASRNFHGMMSSGSDLVTNGRGMPYWQNVLMQERWDHPYIVESNKGFQASSSRNPNLTIGSPQLDLVLQL